MMMNVRRSPPRSTKMPPITVSARAAEAFESAMGGAKYEERAY
jgi:hypothetical protein